MIFVYGRFVSRQLVNTVTSDKLFYKLVSGLIKYQMFICYFLYIAGVYYSTDFCNLSISSYRNGLIFKVYWLTLYRFCMVHSYAKEENVQVSIWAVCMDAHDSILGFCSVLFCCW